LKTRREREREKKKKKKKKQNPGEEGGDGRKATKEEVKERGLECYQC